MGNDIIMKSIVAHQKVIDLVKSSMVNQIKDIADICRIALKNGNKLLICGNGGSAADSQHLAAEFVGRFQLERRGLPAIALTTDTSILTSIGNDYGFEQVFARQVEALAQEGDIFIGLSTSGNSKNVLLAVEKAKQFGLKTISFTGSDGGNLKNQCDFNINIPEKNTARVQEAHILIGHIMCELLDDVNNE